MLRSAAAVASGEKQAQDPCTEDGNRPMGTTAWHREQRACAGVELAVFSAGSTVPDAPLVVLLHGLGHWTSAAWDRLVPQLDPTWRIVAVDLPGFGASSRPNAPYDLAFFAAVLGAFVEDALPSRFVLVGHSLGGLIAAELGGRYPERIARLALIAPAGFSAPARQVVLVRTSPLWARFAAIAPPRGLVAAVWRRAVRSPSALDPQFIERAHAFARDPAWRAAFAGVYVGARPLLRELGEAQRRFARFGGPVLVVWGRHDRYVPVAGARRIPSVYPQAEVAILEGSGHLPMVEEPRAVGSLLRAFLNGPR